MEAKATAVMRVAVMCAVGPLQVLVVFSARMTAEQRVTAGVQCKNGGEESVRV